MCVFLAVVYDPASVHAAQRRPAWPLSQSTSTLKLDNTLKVHKMLSPVFKPATWVGTTRVSKEQAAMGLTLDMAGGGRLYLMLDVQQARNVAETVAEMLGDYDARQSSSVSDSPTSALLPADGQSHVPPAAASAAC